MIRDMDIGDLDQIMVIEEICFSADKWQKEDFTYRFEDSRFVNLVDDRDGVVAGYITAFSVLDEMSIDSVAVNPEYRRQGIAKALIAKAAARKRPSALLLEVRESNAPAIALYSSLGFERVGLRKNYYQLPVENAILMTKSIEQEG